MHRTGFLLPSFGKLITRLSKVMPLELLKRRGTDEEGYFTDAYVLLSTLILALWVALIGVSSSFLGSGLVRGPAVAILIWYVLGLAVFLLRWIFVDAEEPHAKRAVLLFLINLFQLRLVMCLLAILVGNLPAADRWRLFLGASGPKAVSWAILIPYQFLSWLIIGLAIAAVVESIRTRTGSTV